MPWSWSGMAVSCPPWVLGSELESWEEQQLLLTPEPREGKLLFHAVEMPTFRCRQHLYVFETSSFSKGILLCWFIVLSSM